MYWYFIRHAESTNNATLNDDTTNDSSEFNNKRAPDPSLTELGIKQATRTAEVLLSESSLVWITHDNNIRKLKLGMPKFNTIYCSPLRRSLETAFLIQKKVNCKVIVLKDLCEVGGVFHGKRLYLPDMNDSIYCSGLSRSEILKLYPDFELEDKITEKGWWNQPQESIKCALSRADKVIEWIWSISKNDLQVHDKLTDSASILITHGLFQNILMKKLLLGKGVEISPNEKLIFPCDNCGISQLLFCPNTTEDNSKSDDNIVVCLKWNSTDHLDPKMRTTVNIIKRR
ncbi:phosphoglycerate mutase family protein [Cryptosporidium muris RN66]|uniref:Phosphoglycerate mutase family protein n=1 Tax=Cryptosporidium muris (strain RN66) TaxID=441375 RepID=B6AJ62_CRYMR|nr:phosphoglycerate mutase family protein [Cryptosporidium muris RN66]EEA08299.1 phosphoglycerate mutase family protein [Cryptosporidium muris RN66]|eukprot:XP_002142648.1 phosphoglycerate mutase family protein [Cryptosporidium muris RN66]